MRPRCEIFSPWIASSRSWMNVSILPAIAARGEPSMVAAAVNAAILASAFSARPIAASRSRTIAASSRRSVASAVFGAASISAFRRPLAAASVNARLVSSRAVVTTISVAVAVGDLVIRYLLVFDFDVPEVERLARLLGPFQDLAHADDLGLHPGARADLAGRALAKEPRAELLVARAPRDRRRRDVDDRGGVLGLGDLELEQRPPTEQLDVGVLHRRRLALAGLRGFAERGMASSTASARRVTIESGSSLSMSMRRTVTPIPAAKPSAFPIASVCAVRAPSYEASSTASAATPGQSRSWTLSASAASYAWIALPARAAAASWMEIRPATCDGMGGVGWSADSPRVWVGIP